MTYMPITDLDSKPLPSIDDLPDKPDADDASAKAGVDSFEKFIEKIKQIPILERDAERTLAKAARDGDVAARQKLIEAYLKLVLGMARKHSGRSQDLEDLFSAGVDGLDKAIDRFDLNKGFRLGTYARWDVKSAILKCLMCSILKMEEIPSALEKIFSNLPKLKEQLGVLDDRALRQDEVEWIATQLGVTEKDVVFVNQKGAGDSSLNAPISKDEESCEWQDLLVDDTMDQETALIESEEVERRRGTLTNSLKTLNERSRRVLEARYSDEPLTLKALSDELRISSERVRQIAHNSLQKIQNVMCANPEAQKMIDLRDQRRHVGKETVPNKHSRAQKRATKSLLSTPRPANNGKPRTDKPSANEQKNRIEYYRSYWPRLSCALAA